MCLRRRWCSFCTPSFDFKAVWSESFNLYQITISFSSREAILICRIIIVPSSKVLTVSCLWRNVLHFQFSFYLFFVVFRPFHLLVITQQNNILYWTRFKHKHDADLFMTEAEAPLGPTLLNRSPFVMLLYIILWRCHT